MEKEFVPYEIAGQLKELGFDEPCLAFYNGKFLDLGVWDWEYPVGEKRKDIGECPQAPTFSQAFKFIREKYNLIGLVEGGYDNGKNIFTYVIWEGFKDIITDDYFETPEEAELECLNELIKMVKEKNI
jgi:hypothetical protein